MAKSLSMTLKDLAKQRKAYPCVKKIAGNKTKEEYSRETCAADGIQETTWRDVVLKEFNEISIECAKQLQNEPGSLYYSELQAYNDMKR
jgi:hypothetical protein